MADSQDTLIVAGRVFPARSSREIPATLTIAKNIARLNGEDGADLGTAPADQLAWDMPVGQAPRRVRLPDGTLFETPDIDLIDSARASSGWTRLHRSERFGHRLIGFVIAALIGAFLVWRFALPVMVYVAVALTPDPLRNVLDQGSLEGLDRAFAEPTELAADRRGEIQAIFETLLAELDPDDADRSFELQFRSTPLIGPNAFALPGGTVVMTDQLVTMFDDDDVIAGVLAHEIGHVVEDHGLRQLYRSISFYVLVALIAGDTGPILEDALLEGGVLLSLSHSRAHERDADAFGIRLADAAGYDPGGLLAFFAALPDAEETDSGWLSTHPASGERVQAIEDYIDTR
ncbi:MAG: M48 family metallopeptidase [Pseudomonadota bacterium]